MSRLTQGPIPRSRIRGCHPLRPAFPDRSACNHTGHGPAPLSLATTRGISLMSFPPGTEMFQFPGFASPDYGFIGRYPKGVGCPIRISTDQSLLAAPHGFSQRATSFIASWCQGIHRMPFLRSRSWDLARKPNPPPCAGTIVSDQWSATSDQTKVPRTASLAQHTTVSIRRWNQTPLNASLVAGGPLARIPPVRQLQQSTPRDAPEPDLHF